MAARSVYVQLNAELMPNTDLVRIGSGLSHGEWSSGLRPPEALAPPVTIIEWQSGSDGVLTRTQGWVRSYPITLGGSAPANPPDEDTIYITWDAPYVGGNSYSSTAPSPYIINGGSILGSNADYDTANFSLSFADELQTSDTSPAPCYFAPGSDRQPSSGEAPFQIVPWGGDLVPGGAGGLRTGSIHIDDPHERVKVLDVAAFTKCMKQCGCKQTPCCFESCTTPLEYLP